MWMLLNSNVILAAVGARRTWIRISAHRLVIYRHVNVIMRDIKKKYVLIYCFSIKVTDGICTGDGGGVGRAIGTSGQWENITYRSWLTEEGYLMALPEGPFLLLVEGVLPPPLAVELLLEVLLWILLVADKRVPDERVL